MTINEVRTIVYTTFETYMGVTYPTVLYGFDNEAFDSKAEFIEFTVRQRPGGQCTLGKIGDRVFRRQGIVLAQLYTPVDRGLLRLDELGEAILNLFEGKTIDRIMFHNGNYRELGSFNKSWYQGSTSVVFAFDEIK